MKKILFIHECMDGGGAERVLVDIFNSIDYSQYEIDFLLVYNKGTYLNDIPKNINYLGSIFEGKIPFLNKVLIRLHLNSLFEKRQIQAKISKHYDTIVSFMEAQPLKYHGYITDMADRNVTWVHVDFLNHHWSKRYFSNHNQEEKFYKRMDKIVFVSETARENFKKLFTINDDITKVIHNPINSERIKSKSIEYSVINHKFTLCCIGRLHPVKRHDRLLKAIKILKENGCDLYLDILGSGPLEENLKKQCAVLNIQDIVNFRGFCSNPYPYLKNSDVFILSSDAEGYPTVVCEALVLGIPVVATNIVGTKDLLDNSKYGILTDLTPESIANGVYELYSSTEKYKNFQEASLMKGKTLGIKDSMLQIYEVL